MAGEFPENVEVTIELYETYKNVYLTNLRYASERLEMENIMILIEPISTIPNYFLNKTDQAIGILQELNCRNVKLQLDLYHHQMTHGNIAETLKNNLNIIGHIQVGQVPGRHEPDNNGEINYKYIFNYLLKLGYSEWIGCEYIPSGPKLNLDWMQPYLIIP